MKATEARKLVSKSQYFKQGNRVTNLKYIKAYAHLMEASKLIGWKDLSYTVKRFQQFEFPETGYELTHKKN